MEKAILLNEIKSMELKLHALVETEKPKIEFHTSASLCGILKGSDNITIEDIEVVKVKSKEIVAR